MKKVLVVSGIILAVVMAVAPAGALSFGVYAEHTVDSVFDGIVSESDGTHIGTIGGKGAGVEFYGNPYSDNEEERGSFGAASSYADMSGTVSGSASLYSLDDVNSMDFHASSYWTDTVTNNTGVAASYDFDFFFSGGDIYIDGNGGMAMFNLEILLNGNSVWSRSATLSGNPNIAAPVFTTDMDQYSEYGYGTYVGATFDSFSGNLDLGPFAAGEAFTLTYNMEVWASTDIMFGSAGVSVGDPFSGGFSGVLGPPVATPVPEPATMLLLGMGLAGVAVRSRRKSAEA